MIKNLRYLCTLLLIAVASAAWGQSDYSAKEETGEDVTLTAGTNGSACTVNGYDGIKVGTSKLGGDMTITVPAGTTHLHLHAVAWKGVTGLSLNITGATTSPSSISLTADDGISSNSPFTLNGSASDFYFVVALSNITAETTLTLTSSSAKRFVVWGVNAEKVTGPLPPSIVANNVDIAYNATSGSIEYSINNKVDDGELTASTDANWLTLGTVGETIPFTCPANDDGAARSADVTLTYTYNTSETVTNTITITQAGNPNGPGSLSNPYTVSQARAAIDEGIGTTGVYATGIVSAIPTAYDEGYKNITFNFVDESGALEFLQAYRCIGDEAENVQVGDIVVVYGDLTKYNSTYEFAQGCKLISLTHPIVAVKAPTFNPSDGATFEETMEVELNQEDGKPIYYNINSDDDPTSNSTLYEEPFTINATSTIKAIAKDGEQYSSVATATYTKLAIGNISEITEVGTLYKVRGTVVATNNKGLVIGDGTGYVYYYKNGAVSQSIGDKVTISGTTGTYGHIIQFTNTATITEASTSSYNNGPAATVITEVPDYSQGYHLSTYLEFKGTLNKSNSSYYIAVGEGQIQISYPTTEQGTALTALADKTVHVKGYFAGINSSDKFTVMLESVEEVAGTDPVINAENVTLAYDATSGEIAYTIENSVDGTSLTAALKESAEWISGIAVTSEKVTFTTTANEGNADRTATITLTYGDVSKEVSVTQKHLVIDYATLPFAYDGNGSGTLPLGLTQNGVGTYNTSPAMKFDGTGDWLILKFNEQPGKLTFDIKGNSFSDGTFKVQTSEDGLTYTDLKTYTELGNTQNEEFNNLGENVRYIKWIYTEKVNGNVALGNINLVKPGQVLPPVISANNVTIAADATSGEISYSIANPDDGVELTATTDVDWISNIVVSAEKITFSATANIGNADRIATFILKYEGAESKEVTVTQKHVVADIAGLPFEFDGGKADIANTAGLTHEGLDSDYGSSPKLKFNSTGDYLLLHFNEQPGKLTYAIKGNSFSGGTFKVQTSADGESFTDLGTYTALDETTQSEEFINLSADARYIKWIYTEKVSGNVALGLIKLEKPSNDPIISAEDVTIEANATSGEIAYTITNPIEGTTLSASTDTEWISIPDNAVSADKVTFTTTINTGAERTGVIKLTYGSVTKEVNVKQKRSVISGNVRYELVNSTDGLTDGQYLIVSSLGEFAVAFDGSLETLDAVGNNKLVTVTNNVIMATDAISFTITAKDGGYSIKSYSGLYIGNTSDANILKTSPSDDYVNAISFDEDGNADVVSAETYLRYNATSNQDRFRYYKSSSYANQEAIKLFKKVSSTETLLGDVNGDTKIDIADVTALVNALKEGEQPEEGDIDGQNGVNSEDVKALVEMILSNRNQ